MLEEMAGTKMGNTFGIVTSRSIFFEDARKNFVDLVNEIMKKGWIPEGGVSFTVVKSNDEWTADMYVFMQGMTIHDE